MHRHAVEYSTYPRGPRSGPGCSVPIHYPARAARARGPQPSAKVDAPPPNVAIAPANSGQASDELLETAKGLQVTQQQAVDQLQVAPPSASVEGPPLGETSFSRHPPPTPMLAKHVRLYHWSEFIRPTDIIP
jgi:hypothetical protein